MSLRPFPWYLKFNCLSHRSTFQLVYAFDLSSLLSLVTFSLWLSVRDVLILFPSRVKAILWYYLAKYNIVMFLTTTERYICISFSLCVIGTVRIRKMCTCGLNLIFLGHNLWCPNQILYNNIKDNSLSLAISLIFVFIPFAILK